MIGPEPILEKVVEAHTGFVHALALRWAPAPGLADDIAQQVFLEFVRKAAQWDLTADVRPLLATMTRNVAQRIWRETMRTRSDIQRQLAEHIRGLAAERELSPYSQEQKAALRSCLEMLPPKSRRLVNLHYELELSSVEIGKEMVMNPDAIRRALFRLREQLRTCMRRLIPEMHA